MAQMPGIADHFSSGPSPYWQQVTVGRGETIHGPDSIIFAVEGAESGALSDAEIGDYHHKLTWRPPLRMEVRARFSHLPNELLGTAGFGFWNNPFRDGKMIASPNAVWYFFASPPSEMGFASGSPGHGWKAYSLNSGTYPSWLVSFGNFVLQLPVVRIVAFQAASSQIKAEERPLDISMTEWRTYRLDWLPKKTIFTVDGEEIFRAQKPPSGPLGFVAWVDNQFAVIRADGRMEFGTLAIPHRQWLELEYVHVQPL